MAKYLTIVFALAVVCAVLAAEENTDSPTASQPPQIQSQQTDVQDPKQQQKSSAETQTPMPTRQPAPSISTEPPLQHNMNDSAPANSTKMDGKNSGSLLTSSAFVLTVLSLCALF